MTRICRQDILRYLGIHARQLHAWERAGLIAKAESYSLEDCGRLRTLRNLRAARLSNSSISASVLAMQKVSGMANPLLEAGAVRSGSRLLFRHRGSLTEPIARQFVFDFEPERGAVFQAGSAAVGQLELPPVAREALISKLFIEAVQLEDASKVKDAVELYQRILELDPAHAPACINLGTISYNQRQFVLSEQLYRRATVSDPGYALAFFDLGNVLDEVKRLPEAVEAYRTAIRLLPGYADAHYNLALAYERLGERRRALRHWTTYLKLDPASHWANHARMQTHKILDREKLKIIHRSPRIPGPRHPRRSGASDLRLLTAL